MGKIVVLDEGTAAKIAAGEVVERPASIVKELIENSIDAKATSITVEIKNGGKSYIRVTDNGTGIQEDDIEIAFERYSTSKIRKAEDLETIGTLGFRGEALSSIAAVSNVELITKTKDTNYGTRICLSAGSVVEKTHVGTPTGTSVIVRDLFFNTPARYKFLSIDSAEAGNISDLIGRIALCTPQVCFKLINNGTEVLRTPGDGDLKNCIHSIYGSDIANALIKVIFEDDNISICGYIGNITISRANRGLQTITLNSRYIKSKTIDAAINEAYRQLLPQGKFGFAVLNITTNPSFVDVNVHPSKMVVKFSDEQLVFTSVYHAVSGALQSRSLFNSQRELTDKHYGQMDYKYDYKQAAMVKQPETTNILFDGGSEQGTSSEQAACSMLKTQNTIYTNENNIPKMENNNNVSDLAQKIDASKQELKLNLDYRIIGQAFSTYIFIEKDDEIYVIDQHAAHERIMYEKLVRMQSDLKNMSQMLIAPQIVGLTSQEIEYAKEYVSDLEGLGFKYEMFGGNTVALRSVPYALIDVNCAEVFKDIIDMYIENIKKKDVTALKDAALYQLACKSAVKANKKLSDIEIENLIKDLLTAQSGFTCPHGRPTVIGITRYELEKKFLRVQ